MSFCTLTPSRGDRHQFLEFCKHQLSRMSVKPDKSYFIDWKPQSDDFDLVTRIKDGIHQAMQDGFNEVIIIEDDDFIRSDHFEKMALNGSDFVGEEKTTYYNLRNRTWQTMSHPGRSSLFITGFKISALKDFNWPRKNERFLDISLWEHAKRHKLKRKFVETGAIGVKHGQGLFAGRGHVMEMKNKDLEMEWLKSNVDQDAFTFYKSLNL